MKIDTKEKYDRIHAPLKPKSRIKKKTKMVLIETVRGPLKKLVPFIPDKDKDPKPFKSRNLKRMINPWNLLEMWTPVMGTTRTFTTPGIKGRIKNAANIRSIKKSQRRRSYLKLCRG